MSFAPVWGPESPSHAYIRPPISTSTASPTALHPSLLATMFTWVDNVAMRIPSSCCIVCQSKRLIQIMKSLLRKYGFIPEERTNTVVFDTGTEHFSLRRLEDIDVEKAIYRKFPPSSMQSIKVQLPGGKKPVAEVRLDDARSRRRGLKHQRSLVDGFYIMPGRNGTQTTMNTTDTHEDQLAELPAPELFKQRKQPVELPAGEISPVAARLPSRTPPQSVSSTPLLHPPKPRSPSSRRASPLLAPPPFRDGLSEQRSSYSSSLGSGSIQIAYMPSPHDEVEREKPVPLKALDSIL